MVRLCGFTFRNRSRRCKLNKVQKMSQRCASLLLFLWFSVAATLSSGKFQDYRKLLYEIFVLKGSSYFWYQRCHYYQKRRARYFRVRATITCFLKECLFWRIVALQLFLKKKLSNVWSITSAVFRVVALGQTMHCVPKSFGRLPFEQKESSKKNRNH